MFDFKTIIIVLWLSYLTVMQIKIVELLEVTNDLANVTSDMLFTLVHLMK